MLEHPWFKNSLNLVVVLEDSCRFIKKCLGLVGIRADAVQTREGVCPDLVISHMFDCCRLFDNSFELDTSNRLGAVTSQVGGLEALPGPPLVSIRLPAMCNADEGGSIEDLPVLLGRYAGDVEKGKTNGRSHRAEKPQTPKGVPASSGLFARVTVRRVQRAPRFAPGRCFCTCQGVTAPAIALFTGESIATLTAANPTKEQILVAMAPALLLSGCWRSSSSASHFGWQTCLAWAAAKQAHRWHRCFLEAFLSQDISWYDENETAGMASKLEADVANVYVFMCTALGYLIASLGRRWLACLWPCIPAGSCPW